MRALTLTGDRKLELVDLPSPAPPAAGEVQIRVKAVALNHLDLWGYRGMAFAKRKMPVVVGVEAAGEVAVVGAGADGFKPGDPVVMYGALTCGICKACREGRDNLCENVGGIMGFHIDGFGRDLVNMPARLTIPVPKGVGLRDAACAPIAFATVQHMLFDNAKLEPGESVLVHAGGSGIGSVAIKMAKAIGCMVITTIGDDAKAEKAKELGADHVINEEKGRRRRLRARRRRDLQRLAAVPQARRTARHLRLDLGTDHDHQPDAAVPAAISDHRLVRRVHAEHPGEPRQDGKRHAAGHRHRGAARRFRARAGTARKPAGVRKNRRHVLTNEPDPCPR
jgi:NADPH:quinone reductase-like Zn-dependent oxidoreductase